MRSWWHHEQVSIAAAVAAALHHSARPVTYKAPRGQKTATEEVEKTSHNVPRHQKTPLPGGRPGVLKDPAPQGAVTVGYVAAPGPLLSTPSLADTAAEAVDARTVKFLLQQSLARKKKEEEEERRRKVVAKLQEEKAQWRAQRQVLEDEFMALLNLESRSSLQERRFQDLMDALDAHDASKPSSGSSRRRKRKKRRKKKLPRCGLFPPGFGRLRDLHRQVPAVQVVHVFVGAPATIHRQSGGHSCFSCRDVYPQCKLCSTPWGSYRCCSWTVPPPGIGGVGCDPFSYLSRCTPLRVVSAIVCGLGMSMDFVDPVSSGMYSGTFVFSAPVAEPIVMSFTVPLSYCTFVATATVVASCSSSSGLQECLRHDVVWWSRWCLQFYLGQREADYWKILRLLFPVPRGRWGVCLLNVWFSSNDEVCADNYFPGSSCRALSQCEVGIVSVW